MGIHSNSWMPIYVFCGKFIVIPWILKLVDLMLCMISKYIFMVNICVEILNSCFDAIHYIHENWYPTNNNKLTVRAEL